MRRVPEAQLASDPGRAIPLNDTARPLPFIGPLPVRPDGTVGECAWLAPVLYGEGRKGRCQQCDSMGSRVWARGDDVTEWGQQHVLMSCGWHGLLLVPCAWSQGVLRPSCITARQY